MTISILETSFLLRSPNSPWRQFNNSQRQKLKKTFSSIFQIDTYITDLLFDKHLYVVLDSVDITSSCSGLVMQWEYSVVWYTSMSLWVCITESRYAWYLGYFNILVLTTPVIIWPLLLFILFIYLFSLFFFVTQPTHKTMCIFFPDLLLCLIHIQILTAPLFITFCHTEMHFRHTNGSYFYALWFW